MVQSCRDLTDKNVFQYALANYDNPSCTTIDEFEQDLLRFVHIKKILIKPDFCVQKALNHIRIQYNIFKPEACTHLLFYRCYEKSWPQLKTFLVYLSYMPDSLFVEVPLDQKVVSELRKL
jgi:hypothetical protein